MKLNIEIDEVTVMEKIQKGLTSKQIQDQIARKAQAKLVEQMSSGLASQVEESLLKREFFQEHLREETVDLIRKKVFTEKFKNSIVKKVVENGDFLEELTNQLGEMLDNNIRDYKLSLDFIPKAVKSNQKNKKTGGKR